MAPPTARVTSRAEVDDRGVRQDRSAGAADGSSWARRLGLLLPAALMLCLGLTGLDRHSVWRDEAASLVAAQRTLPELWTMLGRTETAHALYYTLLHGWLQLGSGEVWARVPSVLAMTAAAGLVTVIGAQLVSVRVGVVAGLLFAVNPAVTYYAQEARSTALVAAFALLTTWCLLRAVRGRRGWWAVYAVSCLVLVSLNLLAFVVPVALAVTLLWWSRSRRLLLRWALATAPAVLAVGTLYLVTSRQPYQLGWIPSPGLSSVRDFAHLALGPNVPVIALVSLLVLAGTVPNRSLPARRLRALALPLTVVPSAVLLAVSLVQPLFVPRYVFPSVAGVCLLAALGVVRVGAAAARLAPRLAPTLVAAGVVLAVALGGLGTQRLDRTTASRPDDLAAAAAVVAREAHPGDAVLFLPDNRRLLALVYPAAFAGLHDLSLAEGPAPAGNLTGSTLPLAVTLQNISASQRVWAIGRPGLTLVGGEGNATAELALLDRDFVPVQRTGADGVGITLYVARSAAR